MYGARGAHSRHHSSSSPNYKPRGVRCLHIWFILTSLLLQLIAPTEPSTDISRTRTIDRGRISTMPSCPGLRKWSVRTVAFASALYQPSSMPLLEQHTYTSHYATLFASAGSGAKQSEIAHTSTLTSNIHSLFISFYRPTKTRWRILIEKGAFPSDWVRSAPPLSRFLPTHTTLIPRANRYHSSCVISSTRSTPTLGYTTPPSPPNRSTMRSWRSSRARVRRRYGRKIS
jgi:hypothetical protein